MWTGVFVNQDYTDFFYRVPAIEARARSNARSTISRIMCDVRRLRDVTCARGKIARRITIFLTRYILIALNMQNARAFLPRPSIAPLLFTIDK